MKLVNMPSFPGLSTCVVDESLSAAISADLPEIDEQTQALVDQVWRSALESGKDLYDSPVVCLPQLSLPELECFIAPYRLFFAQLADARLRTTLNLDLLSVSGILLHRRSAIFGRRSERVTQYAGFWELTPSGSIDAIKFVSGRKVRFIDQLAAEFEEELHLPASMLQSIRPLLIIHDRDAHCFDICCLLKIEDALEIDWHAKASSEYSELKPVSFEAIAEFLEKESGKIVPTSDLLIRTVMNDV